MSLARLLPSPPARIARGEVLLTCRNGETENVLNLTPRQLRKIRGGEIAYIFQEPSVSLNPVFRIGAQIAEAIELHRPDVENVEQEVADLLLFLAGDDASFITGVDYTIDGGRILGPHGNDL